MKQILAFTLAVCATSAANGQTPPPAAPSSQAEALGRELAEQGMLSKLLPMVAMKETEDMIANTPDLTDAEGEVLRTTAREIYEAGMARVIAAQGQIYAEKLSQADLQALVDFNRSPASQRHQAIMPEVIEGTVKSLDGIDYKGETMAAFCKKTGRGCEVAE